MGALRSALRLAAGAALVVFCAVGAFVSVSRAQEMTLSGVSTTYLATLFLPLTGGTVTGGAVFTRSPSNSTAAQATVRANPASAAANGKLFDGSDNSTSVWSVDKEGDEDVRTISNSGGSTCSGVGTAGAVCLDDTNGTVVSGSGAASPFIVEAKANTGVDYLLSLLDEDDTTNFWMTFLNSTGSGALPALLSRGAAYGFLLQSGVSTANDTGSTHISEFRFGRENGTYNSASFSAPSTRPLLGIGSGTTVVHGWHINGRMGLSTISPTNLSGDVNNYAGCTTTAVCRINDGGAGRNVTGITPAYTATLGDLFFVCAVGSNNLTLVHQSASSSSANRFTFNGSTNRTVLAGSCFPLVYDVTSATWRAANGT